MGSGKVSNHTNPDHGGLVPSNTLREKFSAGRIQISFERVCKRSRKAGMLSDGSGTRLIVRGRGGERGHTVDLGFDHAEAIWLRDTRLVTTVIFDKPKASVLSKITWRVSRPLEC